MFRRNPQKRMMVAPECPPDRPEIILMANVAAPAGRKTSDDFRIESDPGNQEKSLNRHGSRQAYSSVRRQFRLGARFAKDQLPHSVRAASENSGPRGSQCPSEGLPTVRKGLAAKWLLPAPYHRLRQRPPHRLHSDRDSTPAGHRRRGLLFQIVPRESRRPP